MCFFGLSVAKMKKIVKSIALKNKKLLRVFFGLFYPAVHLTGRHFEHSHRGWGWVAKGVWFQKTLGFNRYIPWPAHHTIKISNVERIHFHPDDLNIFQSPGVYYQCLGADIYIGRGAYIAPNVGIITTNHTKGSLDTHDPGKDVYLGAGCWIGMNAVILPGVRIGDRSIVGAGAVVTKDVPSDCVVVGNPAKIITEKSNPISAKKSQ